ncbi:MAG: hypothetical protein EGQ40_04875 [Clostridiales bacterium]|nr:hypothetical protein [Clostridiales bacterium]
MKKKILAALMAAVMLFTILPLGTLDTAWAEERASATAGEGSVSGGKLLEGYLYRLAGMDIRSYENGFNSSSMAATYSAKANLNAEEKTVYNTLKAEIEKIASGQRKDTNIKTTGVLGSQASADKVWHALLSDLPYELYWHDKVIGINYAYTLAADNTPFKDVTFSFAVAQEFRGKDMTTTNIPNVPAAVQTARSVVAANASKSDHDKLQAYRQYICDQVSYNYAAARGEYANSYGNPWQLLWVFDGDSTTNVVCEGYAKSFKYLCDLTEESNGWTGDVETINVTGTMGTENHMWNIVRIGGGNYLVDVTNCDTGMKGYPQKLFLRGAVGDGISYTVENTVYTYGTETRTGFAAADLKLSGTDYTPAATTLTAPTVTLKADAASGQPVISWSKVGGATQYEVYRSATGKANSFSIIRRTSALTYTDVNAAAGNTYYYVVRAMKGFGSSAVYSKFSPAQSIQYAITSLNAPSMTLTSAASGQPVISWTKVNGAAQYEIYRSATGKANSFSIIRRTSALTYTDTTAAAGNTYYYVVRAISGSVKSAFCPAQSIQYAITSLNAPTMTLTSAASGQPVVSWTKVSGAAQYEVYRSATGKANSFSIIRRTSALTYTDVNAAAGNTYYYVVRAINGSVKSAFCAAQSIQYAVASLTAPTMTLTSAASGQPVVSWTKVNGAAQYEVYRSTNGKNFSIVRRTAALSYTDTSAAAGTTYYYQVRAINGSVKSAFCAAQSIQYAVASLNAPTMTLTSAASGQPVVSWTKVNGAAQYEVYRSTNGKNFSIVRRTAALSYTDTSAAAGTTYYYQVRAINGSVKSAFCPAQSISLTVSEYAGECGSRATWRLTDDGVLTISGKDGIYEYGWYEEDDVYHPAPWAEEGMPAVKKLVVNSGITYIGGSAFEGLDQLTSVSLPDTLEYIGWSVFRECASLTSIVIPEGTKYLYGDTFIGCTSLRSAKLPSTLEFIDGCVFIDCTSLQDIVLPEGIDHVPWRMFDGCTSLRSVTIPSSIMSVSNDAFSGCTALTSVIFGGSRTDWENMTFNTGNDALRRVTPTCTGSTALAAPVVTGSTNRSGMPLIQWNKVSGAARYQLWCSRIYDDFGAVAYDLHADWDEEWFWDGNCCSYLNNGSLEDGVTYSYKVRAVDANGNVGAFSKEIRITFEPVLATPVISVTTNAQYQPVLAWDKVSGAGCYEVWRWCEEDETDQCIRRTAGLTWTDTTAELGKTYWYYLRAYSPDWNFTTDTGSYYSAWGYSMRWDVLDTPEITEVYSPEAGKAVLGWTKVSGADQYEIYRSPDGENYSIVRRTAALTWTDTTVQSGRVYYKIRAVVNVGSAKGYSDFLWTNFFVR